MPIKRRTIIEIDDDENVGDEANAVDITDAERDYSPDEVEAMRLIGFVDGNNGQSPHPKDVEIAQLLAGVQFNPNAVNGDKQFARIEGFYRDRIRSPATAIRAFCVICEGGPKNANNCKSVTCPLWPFRQGRNAYHGRKK